MPDIAVHSASRKMLSGLSSGEKLFSLLIALAFGVGAVALAQKLLMLPPAYPDFLVCTRCLDCDTANTRHCCGF